MVPILIANDDVTSRNVLRYALTGAGYSVSEATTKEQTLMLLHTSRVPLVVLLDFSLAKWHGMAILSAAAADPILATRHAYVLMLLRDQTISMAMARDVRQMHVSLIAKPIRLTSIVTAVASAAQRLALS
ncbi:MAG: response regulator [Ktedonobacterales bacterium]|nr:response regulator [Ktedonobacterales bacterium]